uniref:Uncharacterized protein n=1 Tax=Glossina brevipalpis TaxID=37001 RepID=A0A1A9W9L1_9MUSC
MMMMIAITMIRATVTWLMTWLICELVGETIYFVGVSYNQRTKRENLRPFLKVHLELCQQSRKLISFQSPWLYSFPSTFRKICMFVDCIHKSTFKCSESANNQ